MISRSVRTSISHNINRGGGGRGRQITAHAAAAAEAAEATEAAHDGDDDYLWKVAQEKACCPATEDTLECQTPLLIRRRRRR